MEEETWQQTGGKARLVSIVEKSFIENCQPMGVTDDDDDHSLTIPALSKADFVSNDGLSIPLARSNCEEKNRIKLVRPVGKKKETVVNFIFPTFRGIIVPLIIY